MENISNEDLAQLKTLLNKLSPGFQPYDIFLEIARLVALPIIEFVPLRKSEAGQVQVLLLQRGKDDPIWPDMVHTPGSVVLATDSDLNEAFQRIMSIELKDTKVSDPHYVETLFNKSRRGSECAQIYWVEVLGPPTTGSFYDVDNLPDNLIESQIKFIKKAVEDFKAG